MKSVLICVVAACACGPAYVAAAGAPPRVAASSAAFDGLAEVWAALLPDARSGEPTVESLVARLLRLGESAVAPVVAVLTGEAQEPDVSYDVHPRAVELRLAVLHEALRRLPRAAVIETLASHAGTPRDADRRILVVSTLAVVGGRDALERALALAAGLDAVQHERDFVRAPLERTFARFAEADRSALASLSAALERASGAWAVLLAHVVAGVRQPEAAVTLARNLGRDARLDVELVRGIGRCAAFSPSVYEPRELERLRQGLRAKDLELVHATMETLAIVGDADVAGTLVDALESREASTAFVARRALEILCGGARGTDVGAWRAYVDAETAWATDRLPLLADSIAEGNAEVLAATATELLSHPLSRVRAAAALRPRLAAAEPGQRALGARLLGQIGARNAVPWLVELVHDSEPVVRTAATDSLVALTGLGSEAWSAGAIQAPVER